VLLRCSLALALAVVPAAAAPIDPPSLYRQLTQESIFEPASLLLFGGALTAVAARMRRSRRAASRG
jgi:hypothetical protein